MTDAVNPMDLFTSSAPINNMNIGSATYIVCVKRLEFAGFTAEEGSKKQ
jgi:hypothetical protein